MTVELAYLAGFFDGEGSLGNWRSGTGRTFMMSVGNTNREILEDYHRRFGGTVVEKALDALADAIRPLQPFAVPLSAEPSDVAAAHWEDIQAGRTEYPRPLPVAPDEDDDL